MNTFNFSIENIYNFVSIDEIMKFQPAIDQSHQAIFDKTGRGSDF